MHYICILPRSSTYYLVLSYLRLLSNSIAREMSNICHYLWTLFKCNSDHQRDHLMCARLILGHLSVQPVWVVAPVWNDYPHTRRPFGGIQSTDAVPSLCSIKTSPVIRVIEVWIFYSAKKAQMFTSSTKCGYKLWKSWQMSYIPPSTCRPPL